MEFRLMGFCGKGSKNAGKTGLKPGAFLRKPKSNRKNRDWMLSLVAG